MTKRYHDTSKLPDIVKGRIRRRVPVAEGSTQVADKLELDYERRPRTYQEATGRERPQKPPKYPLYDLEIGEGFVWLPSRNPIAEKRTRANVWQCAKQIGMRVKSKKFYAEDGEGYVLFWRVR